MAKSSELFKSICGFTDEQTSLLPEDIFQRLNTDSRKVDSGQWFLPLVGERFDGHDYIEKAMADGAEGYFYSDPNHIPKNKNSIRVTDTLKFYGQIAKIWRILNEFKVIAVTGSSGKTTFKELLNVFLEEHGITHRTTGNYNNEIGVPISILSAPGNSDYAIIEMGARHLGDLKYLSQITLQDVSVLLNVGNAHIGEFGSFENLVKTKCEIVKYAPTTANAVINGDQEIISEELSDDTHNKIRFSESESSQVKYIGTANSTLKFEVDSYGEVSVKIPYWHDAFPINIAAVLATLLALEIPIEKEYKCLKEFEGLQGRFKIIKRDALTIIDDCYNANLDSMKVGIASVAKNFDMDQTTLILGDMLELGEDSKKYHLEIAKFIDQLGKRPKMVISIGQNSKEISDYASSVGISSNHYEKVEDYLKNIETLKAYDDILYLKGSNSIKLNKIIDYFS